MEVLVRLGFVLCLAWLWMWTLRDFGRTLIHLHTFQVSGMVTGFGPRLVVGSFLCTILSLLLFGLMSVLSAMCPARNWMSMAVWPWTPLWGGDFDFGFSRIFGSACTKMGIQRGEFPRQDVHGRPCRGYMVHAVWPPASSFK